MGSCSSASTDEVCGHKQPYVVLCTSQGCQRSDRRMCYECVEDHKCPAKSRVRTDDINNNKYGIFECINNYYELKTSSIISKRVTQFVQSYKDGITYSYLSVDTLLKNILYQVPLGTIPDSLTDIFKDGAEQINMAVKEKDFGFIGQQGTQLLRILNNDQTLIQSIQVNLEISKKILLKSSQDLQQQFEQICKGYCDFLEDLPKSATKEVSDASKCVEYDNELKSLNDFKFPIYTQKPEDDGKLSKQCSQHNMKFVALCVESSCYSKDHRLCSECLIDHECDPNKRIKEKTFATTPLYQVISKFLAQKSEISNYTGKISEIVRFNQKNIEQKIENLSGVINNSLFQCFQQDETYDLQNKLSQSVINQLVDKTKNLQQLSIQAVEVLVVLLQNPDTKTKIEEMFAKQDFIIDIFFSKLHKLFQENGQQFIESFKTCQSNKAMDTIIQTTILPVKYILLKPPNLTENNSEISKFEFSNDPNVDNQLIEMKLDRIIDGLGENEYDSHITEIINVESLKQIIISSKNGKICIYDYLFKLIKTLSQDGTCLCLEYLRDKNILLSHEGSFSENKINLWDIQKGQIISSLAAQSDPIWKIRSIDSQLFLSCSGDGKIYIWVQDNEKSLVKSVKLHSASISDVLVFSNTLIITASQDSTIQFYNFSTDKVVGVIKDDEWIYCLTKINNSVICFGTGGGFVKCYNINNQQIVCQYNVHKSYISGIVSIGQNHIATTSNDRTSKLIKLQDGTILNQFQKDEEYENDSEVLCYVPQLKKLIYGDWNKVFVQE